MKISKTSWMILASGVFIIVLIGLGMTRSGQISEQSRLEEELLVSAARLEKLHPADLQPQLDELEEQLQDALSLTAEAREKMKQTVISVDVADKFFEIAGYYGVTVNSLGTSSISNQPYESIDCETISLSASVTGI
jgi:hypothetical protein